jgi:hypothetical protein
LHHFYDQKLCRFLTSKNTPKNTPFLTPFLDPFFDPLGTPQKWSKNTPPDPPKISPDTPPSPPENGSGTPKNRKMGGTPEKPEISVQKVVRETWIFGDTTLPKVPPQNTPKNTFFDIRGVRSICSILQRWGLLPGGGEGGSINGGFWGSKKGGKNRGQKWGQKRG